jgi:hypothetical protein
VRTMHQTSLKQLADTAVHEVAIGIDGEERAG